MLLLITTGCGFALVAGGYLIVHSFRDRDVPSKGQSRLAWLDPRPAVRQRKRLSVAVASGVLAGIYTGWPAATVAVGLGCWFLPGQLGVDKVEQTRIAAVEAIATWTEMLRDTLSAAAGLEQAVLASTTVAPDALREPLTGLGSDLRARRPFVEAMGAFGESLADPIGDQVVAALIHAQRNQAKNLTELLGEMASASRAQVTLAVKVHAERAKHRTSQRSITGIFLGMAVVLTVFYPEYLEPYGSFVGQIVLLAVIGMFAGGFAWMRRIVRPHPLPRVLVRTGWDHG